MKARMFKITALPRTMTKRQWKALDRWLRTQEREIKTDFERVLHDAMIYGQAWRRVTYEGP